MLFDDAMRADLNLGDAIEAGARALATVPGRPDLDLWESSTQDQKNLHRWHAELVLVAALPVVQERIGARVTANLLEAVNRLAAARERDLATGRAVTPAGPDYPL